MNVPGWHFGGSPEAMGWVLLRLPFTATVDKLMQLNNNQQRKPEHLLKSSLCIAALVTSVQFSSVAQSCPTLCDPMNHSTPGLPVHYHLPEFTQTHVHQINDAIQPSHPLLSSFCPAPNPSQHQSLFQ